MAEKDLTKMTSKELVEALIEDDTLIAEFDHLCLWELIENKDWLRLVLVRPILYKKMSGIAWFSASEWVELIVNNKNFIDVCTKWESFSTEDWVRLLPIVDEKTLKKCKCWKKFTIDNWVDVLSKYPNFASKCKIFDDFKEKHWKILLPKQPDLWTYSKKQSRKNIMQTGVVSDGLSLKSLSADDWKQLIKQNPKNFEKLNSLKIFSIDDCIELLQLKDNLIISKFERWEELSKAQWDKLDTDKFKDIAKKYKNGRVSLLERHPAYLVAKKDYEERSRQSRWWEKITFSYAPALAEDFSIIEYIEYIPAIDVNSWEIMLKKDKKYLPKCPIEAMSPSNAVRLICIEPSLFAKYDSTKFTVEDWATILKQHPQFADKCTIWNFSRSDWSEILKVAPQLIEKCKCWNKFDSNDWSELLPAQPQFIEKAKEFTSGWVAILELNPELANECEYWEKFNSSDWSYLLSAQPQLWIYCPGESINKIKENPDRAKECKCWDWFRLEHWNILSTREWNKIFSLFPQFADKCDKWNEFNHSDWDYLLSTQPQLWIYCPEESVKKIKEDPNKANECKCWDWMKDCFDSDDWRKILHIYPQLIKIAKKYHTSWLAILEKDLLCYEDLVDDDGLDFCDYLYEEYYKLTDVICELLLCNPKLVKVQRFISIMEYEISNYTSSRIGVGAGEIVQLLKEMPHFYNLIPVDWEKFSTHDWEYLLPHCPQFESKALNYIAGISASINVFNREWDFVKYLERNCLHNPRDFDEDIYESTGLIELPEWYDFNNIEFYNKRELHGFDFSKCKGITAKKIHKALGELELQRWDVGLREEPTGDGFWFYYNYEKAINEAILEHEKDKSYLNDMPRSFFYLLNDEQWYKLVKIDNTYKEQARFYKNHFKKLYNELDRSGEIIIGK